MEICYELLFLKLSVLKNSFGDLMNITALLKYKGYMLTIFLISDKFLREREDLFLVHGLWGYYPSW